MIVLMIPKRFPCVRLLALIIGLAGGAGCVGTPGTGSGFPPEVRANVRDFLVDFAREALAAFLL